MAIASIARLNNLCKNKKFDDALAFASLMDQEGIGVPREGIYNLLQGCADRKDPNKAKKIHALMISSKLDKIPVLADHLIRLFICCGCLAEADEVFSRVPTPSLFTWNAILAAHSKLGKNKVIFKLFCKMQQSGLEPDRVTMLSLLKACSAIGAIEESRLIHSEIHNGHISIDVVLGSGLIDTYAKCGCLEDARSIFDELSHRDVVTWGGMISGYAQQGYSSSAIQLFGAMQVEGVTPNEVIISSVLKGCGNIAALEEGQILHSQAVELSFDSDFVVNSSLVDMYSKCQSVDDAQALFQNLPFRDSALWGAMVAGYTSCGHNQAALAAFEQMLLEGIIPTTPMFLCVLKAINSLCAIQQGRVMHDLLVRGGLEVDLILANAVIDMYAKCGILDDAHRVFDLTENRDVVSWGTLMSGYAEHQDCDVVINLFQKMQEDDIKPDRVVILSTVKACASSGNVNQGRAIHHHLDKYGIKLELMLSNALIDMYVKGGCLEEARIVFDESKSRNHVSWGAMISGYASLGDSKKALELFKQMLNEGMEAGKVALLGSLKACSLEKLTHEGRLLHDEVVQSGLMPDLDVGCALINMYAKCDSLDDATKVFDGLPSHDVAAWTALIMAYAEYGHGPFAVELFERMQEEGIISNDAILLCIVKTCGGISDLREGRLIHHEVLKHGLESSVLVGNFLIQVYAQCLSLEEARHVFEALRDKDEMSWGTIIAGYVHLGHDLRSLDLLGDCEGLMLGKEMLVCILKACSFSASLEQGMVVHQLVVKMGLHMDMAIGSALIHVYAKCNSVHDAFGVFDQLPAHDLVTYSTMIAGLLSLDLCIPALNLYLKLRQEGLKPDKLVQQCMLRVCGTLGSIRQGREIHNEVIRDDLELDPEVRGALVDMYTTCASLEEAHKVFGSLWSCNDAASCSAIIAGYARHGHCHRALQCLEEVEKHGLNPTASMFSSVLMACSHAGFMEGGYRCFKAMTDTHGIPPMVEHLNCMIDLLGRAGRLHEAEDFLLTAMSTGPDVVGWRSLLTGCHKYGNPELGRQCFDHMDPDDTSRCTLISQSCTETSMRDDDKRTHSWVYPAGAYETIGNTCLDDSNQVHGSRVREKATLQEDVLCPNPDHTNTIREAKGFWPAVGLHVRKDEHSTFWKGENQQLHFVSMCRHQWVPQKSLLSRSCFLTI